MEQSKVWVLDGAWGTEFMKRGLKSGVLPETWLLEKRETVKELAVLYAQAGSDIILTNSFGGNRFRLAGAGLENRVTEINRIAAEITREAAAGKAITAGLIGPCGKMFAMGEVEEDELFETFSEQAAALKAGGAEMLVVETMSDVDEMVIGVKAAVATGLKTIASMTYQKTPKGYHTMMGATPETAAKAAEAAGASVIGANCGNGIDGYTDLVPELKKATKLPLWIKANAGIPELKNGVSVYPMTSETYASYVPAMLEGGVSYIGGCCGTTPEFIKKIRAIVNEWNSRK